MWPWHGYWYYRGWGWPRYWWRVPHFGPWAPVTKEQEIAFLEEEARILESELEAIRERLEELKK